MRKALAALLLCVPALGCAVRASAAHRVLESQPAVERIEIHAEQVDLFCPGA
jgi:hypothetical protein